MSAYLYFIAHRIKIMFVVYVVIIGRFNNYMI